MCCTCVCAHTSAHVCAFVGTHLHVLHLFSSQMGVWLYAVSGTSLQYFVNYLLSTFTWYKDKASGVSLPFVPSTGFLSCKAAACQSADLPPSLPGLLWVVQLQTDS